MIKPDVTLNTPEAKQLHVPSASEQQIHSKKKKKPKLRRRRKKVFKTESPEHPKKIPLDRKVEPSTKDPSKRKSGCAYVMDCVVHMFTFASFSEKA